MDLIRPHTLLRTVEGARNRTLTTVETSFGRADVVLDGLAVDIDMHDRDATVHIRSGGGDDPEAWGR